MFFFLITVRRLLESVVVIGDSHAPGVHINWTRVPGAVQYTVYYCRGRDKCRVGTSTSYDLDSERALM